MPNTRKLQLLVINDDDNNTLKTNWIEFVQPRKGDPQRIGTWKQHLQILSNGVTLRPDLLFIDVKFKEDRTDPVYWTDSQWPPTDAEFSFWLDRERWAKQHPEWSEWNSNNPDKRWEYFLAEYEADFRSARSSAWEEFCLSAEGAEENAFGLIHALPILGRMSGSGRPFAWDVYSGDIDNVERDPVAILAYGILHAMSQEDSSFLEGVDYLPEAIQNEMTSRTVGGLRKWPILVRDYRRKLVRMVKKGQITIDDGSAAGRSLKMLKDCEFTDLWSIWQGEEDAEPWSVTFQQENGKRELYLCSLFADLGQRRGNERSKQINIRKEIEDVLGGLQQYHNLWDVVFDVAKDHLGHTPAGTSECPYCGSPKEKALNCLKSHRRTEFTGTGGAKDRRYLAGRALLACWTLRQLAWERAGMEPGYRSGDAGRELEQSEHHTHKRWFSDTDWFNKDMGPKQYINAIRDEQIEPEVTVKEVCGKYWKYLTEKHVEERNDNEHKKRNSKGAMRRIRPDFLD